MKNLNDYVSGIGKGAKKLANRSISYAGLGLGALGALYSSNANGLDVSINSIGDTNNKIYEGSSLLVDANVSDLVQNEEGTTLSLSYSWIDSDGLESTLPDPSYSWSVDSPGTTKTLNLMVSQNVESESGTETVSTGLASRDFYVLDKDSSPVVGRRALTEVHDFPTTWTENVDYKVLNVPIGVNSIINAVANDETTLPLVLNLEEGVHSTTFPPQYISQDRKVFILGANKLGDLSNDNWIAFGNQSTLEGTAGFFAPGSQIYDVLVSKEGNFPGRVALDGANSLESEKYVVDSVSFLNSGGLPIRTGANVLNALINNCRFDGIDSTSIHIGGIYNNASRENIVVSNCYAFGPGANDPIVGGAGLEEVFSFVESNQPVTIIGGKIRGYDLIQNIRDSVETVLPVRAVDAGDQSDSLESLAGALDVFASVSGNSLADVGDISFSKDKYGHQLITKIGPNGKPITWDVTGSVKQEPQIPSAADDWVHYR
jgi:hypothetical protein